MPDAATVTIPDVEILRVGTWNASTGPVTITEQHLADAVAAAADTEVDRAPLKLGHTGKLSQLGDSEPALGFAANFRLSDDGQVLVADYVDVPVALEEPIKKAYPRRSAEIAWGVTTPGGQKYTAVIDGLALLGVQPPAVKGLADIEKLYTPAKLAAAGLEIESRSSLAYYPDLVDEPSAQERLANELRWARQAAANLAALVGIDGLQAVFDALDQMVPVDSRGLLAQGPQPVHVTTASTPGGTMPTKIKDLAKVRTLLGLAEDATEEQVTAKLGELAEAVDDSKGTPAGAPAGGGTDPAPAAALSAGVIEELAKAGLTVIAGSALETLQADAAAGRQAATHLSEQARDGLLEAAYQAGKFGVGEPAQKMRSTFSAQLDKDFEGTKAVIDLLPSIVPVGEIGTSATGPDHTHLSAAADAALAAEIDAFFGTTTQEA